MLTNSFSNTREKLELVNKIFNVKYEELKKAKKLQNYVEQFKNGQDYQELESIVTTEVGKTISDNKKLLQIAFFSVILA